MYEHRRQPLLTRAAFLRRLVGHVLVAFVMIVVSLGVGVLGYHWLGRLGWVDAIENAAMILGGMGPTSPLTSNAAKLFAAGYALFSGIVFLFTVGVMLAPVIHRMMHRLHIEEEEIERRS